MSTKTKTEDKPGCAVCNPKDHPPPDEGERYEIIEAMVHIVCGSGGWYVVLLPEEHGETDGDVVDIVHGPLASREAAEFARSSVVRCLFKEGRPCLGSEVPGGHWNLLGQLLQFLSDHGHKKPEDLARAMVNYSPWESYVPERDRSDYANGFIPF